MIGYEQIPHRPHLDARRPLHAGELGSRGEDRKASGRASPHGSGRRQRSRHDCDRPCAAQTARHRQQVASTFFPSGFDRATGCPAARSCPRYDENTRRRVLDQLDQPPPAGHGSWTGALVAKALGDVSKHQVWRVLRTQGIHLQRRRSWCISTDPEFAAKAADIVALYLDPPEHAVILAVDEKPHIQALERAQGYLKLPNGQAVTGFSHEYKRHGTTTLFAALNVLTGQVKGGHAHRRRRRDFLAFMNEVVALYPGRELHVVVDNLNTHKPKH